MNYRMITYILGWILIFEGLFLSLPTITALIYGESALWSYLLSLSGCLLIGSLLVLKKPAKQQLYAREGGVIVGLSWIVLSAFGAVPFVLTGEIPSYINALFETVSGFTTTGASILSDVEALS
ncbi:MAG: TrkH family potassium uptake protein, partial [Oscillospiraceae bacterium]